MIYAKLGGIAALAALLLWIGWHFGGLSKDDELNRYKTDVEAQHAAQLQAVANVMTQHDEQAAAERAKLQGVIDAYDKERDLAPITTGIVQRLRLVEAASCNARDSVVSGAGTVASGTESASGISGGVQGADRLSRLDQLKQAVFDAGARDAVRLNTAVKLAR